MAESIRYLVAADPVHTFLPETDTTTLMGYELIRRGIPADYLDLSLMDWRDADYLNALKVSRIANVNLDGHPAFVLEPSRRESIEAYRVVLHRKDPPVDEVFVGHCRAFMRAPRSILQINNPALTWSLSEHELPMRFPEYSIPTEKVDSLEELKRRVFDTKKKLVAKPRNTYSAQGISFFDSKTDDSTLGLYWQRWAAAGGIVLQEFASEMESIGDLRVLTFNGAILGSVLRKPKAGSWMGSLHQGATAHSWELTRRQSEASMAISKALAAEGLYFLGLDFIGDRVSEINITCPSALRQVNAVMKIRGEVELIGTIEELRRSLQGG